MKSQETPLSRILPSPARLGRILGLSLLLALPVFALRGAQAAPGLNGAWRMDVTKSSGVTLHTFIVLHQEGDKVTGKVSPNSSGEISIRDVHGDGADTVFRIEWGWNFRVRPEGANLRVVLTYDGGGRDEALAVPVSEESLKGPEALPVPAVRDLPDNGLARTPPMGWNSWNHFAEAVDDRIVREAADAMVSSGMAAAGYVFVNIDDTWESGRDAQGNIVPNRKFPDMKALADYVHGKGLKLGIYSSPGPVTCGGYEGSYGHEEQDARTYAAWGIDYLKYDWCSAGRIYPSTQMRPVYQKMGDALEHCGRAVVFSLCQYGMEGVWSWGPGVAGNLWRTTGDISDNWKRMSEIGFDQGRLAPYAGPGHWNDPDMLEVGNGGMSATEYRTHFSLWCMLSAPLMAGNDLRTMSAETRDILVNREVIAVDQDALGRQGTRLLSRDGVELWAKPLQGGGRAIGLFNRGEAQASASFTWAEAGLSAKPSSERDLWGHSDIAPADGGLGAAVPAHGVVMLVVR
jgi:alpha-galactosidase